MALGTDVTADDHDCRQLGYLREDNSLGCLACERDLDA